MNDEITSIIERIEDILDNSRNETADMLGSYIVGATFVRDDIEQYYEKYPLLEGIAELGAELETLGGSEHAGIVLGEIHDKFRLLKKQINSTPTAA